MSLKFKRQFRPEVYLKLTSWVNRCGGDRAFANRIDEAPRTVRLMIYSTPELMRRFGFSQSIFEMNKSDI